MDQSGGPGLVARGTVDKLSILHARLFAGESEIIGAGEASSALPGSWQRAYLASESASANTSSWRS